MKTRQEIFQKRVETGEAKFNGFDIECIHLEPEKHRGPEEYYVVIHKAPRQPVVVRAYSELLFGPSNFFEVMFGEKVIDASEHCPREPRQCCCGHGLTETEYHKSQCAIAKDKLQYLLESLPTK